MLKMSKIAYLLFMYSPTRSEVELEQKIEIGEIKNLL